MRNHQAKRVVKTRYSDRMMAVKLVLSDTVWTIDISYPRKQIAMRTPMNELESGKMKMPPRKHW